MILFYKDYKTISTFKINTLLLLQTTKRVGHLPNTQLLLSAGAFLCQILISSYNIKVNVVSES